MGSYTQAEILEAGYTATQLKHTYSPADLSSNYTQEEIVSAGYSVSELADGNYTASDLTTNYSPSDLSGSYTQAEIIEAGYTAAHQHTPYRKVSVALAFFSFENDIVESVTSDCYMSEINIAIRICFVDCTQTKNNMFEFYRSPYVTHHYIHKR